MGGHSRNSDLGEVAVAVDRCDLVAACWVEHNGRFEANALWERAEASVRMGIVEEKRQ
jgi:hypothetical protein